MQERYDVLHDAWEEVRRTAQHSRMHRDEIEQAPGAGRPRYRMRSLPRRDDAPSIIRHVDTRADALLYVLFRAALTKNLHKSASSNIALERGNRGPRD